MGYLADGNIGAYFVRLKNEKEFFRLYRIAKKTRKRRVKKKLAKRIDSLVVE